MSGTWEQPHAPRGSGLLTHPGLALGSLLPTSFPCRGMEHRWPCGGRLAPVEGHAGRCGARSSAQVSLCFAGLVVTEYEQPYGGFLDILRGGTERLFTNIKDTSSKVIQSVAK